MDGMDKRLKEARIALRMTQASFCKRLGVSRAYLSLLESGQRKPTLKVVDLFEQNIQPLMDELTKKGLFRNLPVTMDFSPNPVLKIRKRLGLTQQEMGDKLGVAKNYIYLLESGRKPITTSIQNKLKRLLNKHSFQNSWNKEKKEGYEMRDEMIKRLTAVYDELRAIDRELFGARADNKLRDPIKTAMGRLDVAVGRMERAAFNTEGAEVDTEEKRNDGKRWKRKGDWK